jgi:hypothetical protein
LNRGTPQAVPLFNGAEGVAPAWRNS